MEDRLLTADNSRDIAELLINKRGWSVSRIAKVTGTRPEFVHNVLAAKQSFETRDLEALATASNEKPFMLLFHSKRAEKMSREQRALYELAKKEIARHEDFERVLRRKPMKKRSPRTTEAA
jgi:hypothetical protein